MTGVQTCALPIYIHRGRDRTAIEVLHEYVANPEVVARLADQLDRSWRDVRPGVTSENLADPFLAELATVLGPANSHRAAAARQRVWSAVIADATPYNLGALARSERPEKATLPWSIVELGLSSIDGVPWRNLVTICSVVTPVTDGSKRINR